MSDINITVQKREISTKGAVNQLRKEGSVPGILYSKGTEPINISISELLLKPIVYTSEVHLVNLKIDENEGVRSILKDVQFDPLTDKIIHVDFQAITVGKSIQLQVPIALLGSAIGVKEGGRLLQSLHKFDIECLPKDIPEHLEVDISNLEVGDSITVKDLSFENITILNSEDTAVVSVTTIKEVEEEEEEEILEEDENAEPELITKAKPEEESQE